MRGRRWTNDVRMRRGSMAGDTLPRTWTSVSRSARRIQAADHFEDFLAAAHAGQPVVDDATRRGRLAMAERRDGPSIASTSP